MGYPFPLTIAPSHWGICHCTLYSSPILCGWLYTKMVSMLLLISQGIRWRKWAPYLWLAGRGLCVIDMLRWEVEAAGWAWSLHGKQTWVAGWKQRVSAPQVGAFYYQWMVTILTAGWTQCTVSLLKCTSPLSQGQTTTTTNATHTTEFTYIDVTTASNYVTNLQGLDNDWQYLPRLDHRQIDNTPFSNMSAPFHKYGKTYISTVQQLCYFEWFRVKSFKRNFN